MKTKQQIPIVVDTESVLQGQDKQTRLDNILKRIKGTHTELTTTETSFDTLGKKMVNQILEMGRDLIECRTLVLKGKWTKWCNDNLPFTKKTSENYINVVEWLNTDSKHISIVEECKNPTDLYDKSGVVPKKETVKKKKKKEDTTKPSDKPEEVNNFPLIETTKRQVTSLVSVIKDHKTDSKFMDLLKPLVDLYNDYKGRQVSIDLSDQPEVKREEENETTVKE
jgi:hypothetical protein